MRCNILKRVMNLKMWTKALIIFAMIFSISLGAAFKSKNKATATASFNTYDINHDQVLSNQEFEQFFEEDFMAEFAGISIDQHFISETHDGFLAHDLDHNGISLKELMKGLMISEDEKGWDFSKKYEPGYYLEKDL